MKRLVVTAAAALAMPFALGAQGTYDFTAATALMQQAVSEVPLNGATLIVAHEGAVIHESHYGVYGPATRIPIASASKWVSAVAIGTLVDDGLLQWDTTVGDIIPTAPEDKRAITLRQLFSHTSGLPGDNGGCLGNPSMTLATCATEILAVPLATAPGTCFSYGGLSMQLAGRMAEIVTGQSWDQLFIARVVVPLGLVATDYAFTSVAPGYVPVANPRIPGGVRSTARDVVRIAQLFAQNGIWNGAVVLAPATVALMMRDQTFGVGYANNPGPEAYGYGIGLWRNRVDASAVALEVSSPGGFGTWPWFDRATDVAGVVFVRNSNQNTEPYTRDVIRAVRASVGTGQPLFDDAYEGAPPLPGCG